MSDIQQAPAIPPSYKFNILPKMFYEKECPVCFEPYDNDKIRAAVLDCKHLICVQCVQNMIKMNKTRGSCIYLQKDKCPVCRAEMKIAPAEPAIIINNPNAIVINAENVVVNIRNNIMRDVLEDQYIDFAPPKVVWGQNITRIIVKRRQRNNGNAHSGRQIDKHYLTPFLNLPIRPNSSQPVRRQFRFNSKARIMRWLANPVQTGGEILRYETQYIN